MIKGLAEMLSTNNKSNDNIYITVQQNKINPKILSPFNLVVWYSCMILKTWYV